MAFPIVIIDSATGSDSAASGAGPSTALTGTSASTDGAGTVVTLDGSPDLSGVATDGSHVIYLADATAGKRNFGKITGKDNSAKTVTVSDAFSLSTSGLSWAIGGKRASLGATSTRKLAENNSLAGDAMPGWTIRLASGHTETLSAQLFFRRAGDTTNGKISLEADPSASVTPLLTFSNNSNCLAFNSNLIRLEGFELRNTNATKTASVAVTVQGSGEVNNLRINHATDKFWKGIVYSVARSVVIRGCDVANTASDGITASVSRNLSIINSRVRECGGHGIVVAGEGFGVCVCGCHIYGNTGSGVSVSAGAGTSFDRAFHLMLNTIHGNGGSNILVSTTLSAGALGSCMIVNNQLTGSIGGYGLEFSGGDAVAVSACAMQILNNNTGTAGLANASGAYSPSGIGIDDPAVDPQYTDAANGDFSIGTNTKAKGFPLAGTLGIGGSANYSYMDIGAQQRQEAGGGSVVAGGGGFRGGLRRGA